LEDQLRDGDQLVSAGTQPPDDRRESNDRLISVVHEDDRPGAYASESPPDDQRNARAWMVVGVEGPQDDQHPQALEDPKRARAVRAVGCTQQPGGSLAVAAQPLRLDKDLALPGGLGKEGKHGVSLGVVTDHVAQSELARGRGVKPLVLELGREERRGRVQSFQLDQQPRGVRAWGIIEGQGDLPAFRPARDDQRLPCQELIDGRILTTKKTIPGAVAGTGLSCGCARPGSVTVGGGGQLPAYDRPAMSAAGGSGRRNGGRRGRMTHRAPRGHRDDGNEHHQKGHKGHIAYAPARATKSDSACR